MEDVDDEVVVERAARHLVRDGADGARDRGIEEPELLIRERRRLLDEAERVEKPAREAVAADREVLDRSLRRRAVERVRRDAHLAHGVTLDPGVVGHGLPPAARCLSNGIRHCTWPIMHIHARGRVIGCNPAAAAGSFRAPAAGAL